MVLLKLISKIGEKGQVVIPKAIRDQFGFAPNTEICFVVEGDKVIISAIKSETALYDFMNAVKKRKLPNKIDWDKEYYEQFG